MPFERTKAFVRSFRFRVTAWLVFLVIFLMAITTIVLSALVQRFIYAQFDRTLENEREEILLSLSEYLPDPALAVEGNPGFENLKRLLDRRAKSGGVDPWTIRVSDGDDRELYVTEAKGLPPLWVVRDPPSVGVVRDIGNLRAVQGRYDAKGRALWILVARARTSLEQDFKILDYTLILRALLLLVLAPIVGYYLSSQVTEPIGAINRAAARLDPKNLSERLPIRGAGDELDQVSGTINGMLDRIADYVERNRKFTANAAHELRSPLAAMRAAVDVALSRERTPDEYVGTLAELVEEIDRLSSMVSRMLLLAESDAGRLATGDKRGDLAKIVRETCDMFAAVADAREIALIAQAAPAETACDEELLRHLVRNLVDNAIKFSGPGGRVTVTASRDGDSAELVVADRGEGIPADEIPRLFERFYRGDPSRQRAGVRAGTGLGLSICGAIVSAVGGTIRVESDRGQGSRFIVRLPLPKVRGAPEHSLGRTA